MASVGPLESWLLSHDFVMDKPGSWSAPQAGAFCACVMAALGFLNNIVPPVARALLRGASPIPAQGSHLDALEWKDHLFLFINRLASIPFTYHFVVTAWTLPSIVWLPEQATLSNTLLAVPVLFVLYDLFYSLFHRALHIKSVYSLVHKHHHRQHAPSRGAVDALNVHPFEFVCGEYNHLLALWLTQRLLGSVHVAAVLVFIVAGGAAASLNHTRLDVRLPLGTYAVRAHDVHHRLPRSNYGQYTQVWDRLLGTYREWNPPTGKAEGKAQ